MLYQNEDILTWKEKEYTLAYSRKKQTYVYCADHVFRRVD